MKFSDIKKDREWKLPQNYLKLSQPERRSVREQYVKEHGGLCYFCKQKLSEEPNVNYNLNMLLFPKGFLNHPIHLHHNHNTGLTIGAVHAYCNGVLWQYFGE